ncbi:MAG: Rne/Rng family ribonuclease [Planctomycetaceae bacterium]|nr:Rne/Rng family ribonuclease [Planctomycetaceae bacterium]
MSKQMLINTVEGQECRIAIVSDGRLEELYVERASNVSHVGNVYKGRVMNVEPSIQAAFVDFGLAKNGFLHISDLHPQYFPEGQSADTEAVGRKRAHRHRPPIQECLRRGQEVVVQLTKEGIGTKGPTLTTYLSIPGRLLVMMPGMSRMGVSRKIEDEEMRAKARAALADLEMPEDIGIIVRTAGIDQPKKELKRDLAFLTRLWKAIEKRIATDKAPCSLYEESDLVSRTLRDIYNIDIDRIICDSETVAAQVKTFLDMVMPRTKHVIEVYRGSGGLFHDTGLDDEIEKIHARRVEMAIGGSLVIDQAEALVAIDVNSGRFRKTSDPESTAFKINIEAAAEAARQIRLRDLGGVIVIDFIDMRAEKNKRAVEKVLKDGLKTDRAKSKILRISAFGIVEMTRQRVRHSLTHNIYRTCPLCNGDGLIKSNESLALEVLRHLQRACANSEVFQLTVAVSPSVAEHLANACRRQLYALETRFDKKITIVAKPDMAGSQVAITAANGRGSEVAWDIRPSGGWKTLHTEALAGAAAAGELEPYEEEPEEEETTPAMEISSVEEIGPGASEFPEEPAPPEPAEGEPAAQPAAAKKSRRGRRGRRHKGPRADQAQAPEQTKEQAPAEPPAAAEEHVPVAAETEQTPDGAATATHKKSRHRRRRRSKSAPAAGVPEAPDSAAPEQSAATAKAEKPPAREEAPEDPKQQEYNAKLAAALLAERKPLSQEDQDAKARFSPAELLAGEHHKGQTPKADTED